MAWLTSDAERRNYYLGLPYTNVQYSTRFYRDYFIREEQVQENGVAESRNKKFPIYILGGGCDVIAEEGFFGEKKANQLLENGFVNVKIQIYPGLRHSILQEADRAQVVIDIVNWIQQEMENLLNKVGSKRGELHERAS